MTVSPSRRRSPATPWQARPGPRRWPDRFAARSRWGPMGPGRRVHETRTEYAYIEGWLDASFISIMPASDPQLVTLILIHRPVTWAGFRTGETPGAGFSDPAPRPLEHLALP